MIRAVLHIPATRQQVFSVLIDYPRYTEWVPGCEHCRVVSSKGTTVDTEIMLNLYRKGQIGMRFEAVPLHVVNFRMTSGKDLKTYAGSYRLMDSADGNGTIVFAEWDLDLGSPLPKFMVDHAARKSLDQAGIALKRYIHERCSQATAAPVAPSPAPQHVRCRAKRILQVLKTPAGYHVWLFGKVFTAKR
jgi:hypothetical protein